MRYHTHVVTSSIGAVAATSMLNIEASIPFFVGVVIGSVFPDIDEPNSYIGRRSLGSARIINLLFGHRGLTHSLLPVILLVLLSYKFSLPILIGFTLGYLFHIIGDIFSKSGVPLFLPFSKKRFAIPVYTTGGIVENIIFFVSILFLLKITHIFDFMTLIS